MIFSTILLTIANQSRFTHQYVMCSLWEANVYVLY